MSGKWSTPKRCNCKDANGKELGRTCPKLSGRHHGTVGYTTRIPTTTGVRELRRFGFSTKGEADKAANQVWDLSSWAAPTPGLSRGSAISSSGPRPAAASCPLWRTSAAAWALVATRPSRA